MKDADKLTEKLDYKRTQICPSGDYLLVTTSWQSPKIFGKTSAQICFKTPV